MKTIVIISAMIFSMKSFGQAPPIGRDSSCVAIEELLYRKQPRDTVFTSYKLANSNDLTIQSLYVSGLKAIRHDAITRWKFRYSHELKTEINKHYNKQ